MGTRTIDQPQTLALEPVSRVRIRTFRGSVSVVGTDGEPRLEVAELSGGPLTMRHEDGALELGYGDWQRPNLLSWLLHRRRWRRRAVLSLAVPRDCRVDAQVVASGVVVSGLRAPVTVKVVSGDITLAGLSGTVVAETVSGAVEAQGTASDLQMRTVSGDLTLVEAAGGTVRAQTTSGTVTADLQPAGDDDIHLATVSGDVVIRVPAGSGLRVRLEAVSGQVSSMFPELTATGMPGLRAVEGRLGDGSGRLRARTTSGHVTLLRQGEQPAAPDGGDEAAS